MRKYTFQQQQEQTKNFGDLIYNSAFKIKVKTVLRPMVGGGGH
jgi:hypothetical protein